MTFIAVSQDTHTSPTTWTGYNRLCIPFKDCIVWLPELFVLLQIFYNLEVLELALGCCIMWTANEYSYWSIPTQTFSDECFIISVGVNLSYHGSSYNKIHAPWITIATFLNGTGDAFGMNPQVASEQA